MVQLVRGEAAMDVPGREHLWLESLRKETRFKAVTTVFGEKNPKRPVIPKSHEVFKVVVFKNTSRLQNTETVQSICSHRCSFAGDRKSNLKEDFETETGNL